MQPATVSSSTPGAGVIRLLAETPGVPFGSSGTANGGDILIATSGTWPIRRNGSIAFATHVKVSTSSTYIGQVQQSTSGVIGAIGKLHTANFDIIANTAGDVNTGCLTTIWGTSAEIN